MSVVPNINTEYIFLVHAVDSSTSTVSENFINPVLSPSGATLTTKCSQSKVALSKNTYGPLLHIP